MRKIAAVFTAPRITSHQSTKLTLREANDIRIGITRFRHFQKNRLHNFVCEYRWLPKVRMNMYTHRPLGTITVAQHVGDNATSAFGLLGIETKQRAFDP